MSLMSTRMGYFVHTKTATKMLKLAPSVMLFPWEIQRKMGVVKMLNPMLIEYTFLSHQWETPGHPFPDMQQLTEHLHAVTTEYFWLDWFCVPQWSRTDEWLDPIAIMIFEVTMRSFQKLCVHSTTSLAVVKRLDVLFVNSVDLGAYGSLYIASVADDGKQVTRVLEQMDERPTSLVEPRVHFPKGAVPPTLTLSALIGSEQVGIVAETFGGIRLAQVIAVELERKRVFIKISDAGLLGAPPTVTEFEVRWKGSRSNITALITKQTTNRSWTLADRKLHIEQQRVLRLRQAMKGWLQA